MPTQSLSLSVLRPHPHNRRINQEHVADLADSMQRAGQWDSIRARPLDEGMYEIVAGHHRAEAALLLGWPEIRVEIVTLSDEEAEAEILDTNIRRKALDELEEAEALKRLVEVYGWTQRKIADRFNRTQPWVVHRMRLVGLVAEVKEKLINRLISPTHASTIAMAPQELQGALARKVEAAELSTRETDALTRVVTDPDTPADVRQAALQEPKLTAAHAGAIAKVSSPGMRQALINDAAKGLLTAEETEREVQAAIRQEAAPKSTTGKRVEQRLQVFPHLNKAKAALDAVDTDAILALEADALRSAESELETIASRLNRLSRAITRAREHQMNQQKDGKLVAFGH